MHRFVAKTKRSTNKPQKEQTVKNIQRLATAAVLSLAGVISANAHPAKGDDRIVLMCAAEHAPRMAEVARAINQSRYAWVTPHARREMLGHARNACASGMPGVAFVPAREDGFSRN